jgi:signal transduction histidine kinase
MKKILCNQQMMETMMSDYIVRKKRRGNHRSTGCDFENDVCRIIPINRRWESRSVRDIHGRKGASVGQGPDHSAVLSSQKLSKANKKILDILKIMSHDIRSPLASLGAGLKLLQKGAYGKMDQSVSDEIDQLIEVVKGLTGTLEDSLGRAHCIDSGLDMFQERLHLKSDIIEPVLLELSKEIRSRSITVEEPFSSFSGPNPGRDPVIEGDRFWLKALFRNLIMNAIKYGEKGGHIRIDFEDLVFQIRMSVHNTGKPVPKRFRSRLFSKFGRISQKRDKNSEGTGLGLFLVKQIIEGHGGRIWYEAEKNGSNFIFTLPNIPPSASTSQ